MFKAVLALIIIGLLWAMGSNSSSNYQKLQVGWQVREGYLMSDALDHDGAEVICVERQGTKRLVLPEGYAYRGEVDIEEIKTALEQFADNLANAG